MARLALIAAMLMVTVQYSSACTCAGDPQLCDPWIDFIAAVQVTDDGDTVINLERIYQIKVVKFYAASVDYEDIDCEFLHTGINSAACGVDLVKDEYYIISGGIQQHEGSDLFTMHTSICNVIRAYDNKSDLCDVSITSCEDDI